MRELSATEKRPEIDSDVAMSILCRRYLSEFVQEFWDSIIEEELEWSPHMQVMCDEVQQVYERVIAGKPKLYDLIINVPPGTSKSSIATVMAPVWSWTRKASLRHITGSYSSDLSTEHAVKSRDIIRSDRFKKYFPGIVIKSDEDNKTNYKTINGGQRFATSTGGTVMGIHAHVITFDDPLNPVQAASEADLAKCNKFFDQTLPSRKVDKRITPTILIMQRLHEKDPTGHMLQKKKGYVRHVRLPGTLSDFVNPAEYRSIYTPVELPEGHILIEKTGSQSNTVFFLDPIRLGPDQLAELAVDLGSYAYAGQIEQMPTPEGGIIWQKWFIEVPDKDFPTWDACTAYGTDWDLAYTKDDENSASAFMTSGKIDRNVYLFDFGWRNFEFPELIRWMKTKPATHYIEQKAAGQSARQTLLRFDVSTVEVPIKGGRDKVARARMATPMAEQGRVYIKQSMADRLYHDPKQGILYFPRGYQTDLADVLAQCLQRHSVRSARYKGAR